jgi:hypothetical protein
MAHPQPPSLLQCLPCQGPSTAQPLLPPQAAAAACSMPCICGGENHAASHDGTGWLRQRMAIGWNQGTAVQADLKPGGWGGGLNSGVPYPGVCNGPSPPVVALLMATQQS